MQPDVQNALKMTNLSETADCPQVNYLCVG
jgi:hypothetical protein